VLWRRYGSLRCKALKRFRRENIRLKRMYADISLDNQSLRGLFTEKAGPCHPKANSAGACKFCE